MWKWIALLGVLLITFAAGKIVTFALERHARKLAETGTMRAFRVLLNSAARPAQLAIFAIGLHFAQTFLVLDDLIRNFWIQVAQAIGALAGAWFLFKLVDAVEWMLSRWTRKTNTALDDQMVPLLRKTLRVFVVILAALFVAQNIFDMDVGALIAGLGLGGLAFALAAKDSLANLFGSVVIFADRPFAMGERIVIKGYDGIVEEVGFRSTKIRTLTGHVVTVPNSIVANEAVENIGWRRTIRRLFNVTITYDTPPDKVQRAVEIIRELLDARKEFFPEDLPPRVYFDEFNSDSLNILVLYWYKPPEYWDYLEFTQAFNLALLRRFNDEGIEFAFPTQTLYMRGENDWPMRLNSSDGPTENQ